MKYCIELIRDGSGVVTGGTIRYITNSLAPLPRGGDCIYIDGPNLEDYSTKKASLDQNGNFFIEDDAAKIASQATEVAIALRMQRQDFGRRLIAMMSIRNDAKGLTVGQNATLMSTFSAINAALLNGSIDTAKSEIQSVTPDGTLVTQADKDAILSEITANESRLGY
jgi:hypothetical protein